MKEITFRLGSQTWEAFPGGGGEQAFCKKRNPLSKSTEVKKSKERLQNVETGQRIRLV